MTTKSNGWMIRRDEGRLHYELGSLAARLSAQIVDSHSGTSAEKESVVSDLFAMCSALQRAVIDGGRKAYDEELARWREFSLFEKFKSGLDGAMTRMPYPREPLAEED
jgi:hypothetical protein